MNKNIYSLKLHECNVIHDSSHPRILITRVAGGWIYSYMDGNAVFVPYHNEFEVSELCKSSSTTENQAISYEILR